MSLIDLAPFTTEPYDPATTSGVKILDRNGNFYTFRYTQEQADKRAEELNMRVARLIMTKGTAAEDL